MKNKMSSKEALDVFYKDIQAYNNDMRTYPYFKCYQNKCEADMRVWEKKQSEMYETIKADLDRLEILEKEKTAAVPQRKNQRSQDPRNARLEKRRSKTKSKKSRARSWNLIARTPTTMPEKKSRPSGKRATS